MPNALPRQVLLRISPKMLQRYNSLVCAGAGRGRMVPHPYVFTRADGGTPIATAIDRDGIVRRFAQNVPRIEWVDLDGDGIRETPGILLEGSRTNLCLRSEEFDNASWTGAATGVTANSDVAPDGTMTADTLTDDDGAAYEGKAQTFTVANDSLPHVFGIFVKKTTAATNTFGLNVQLSGGTGVGQFPRLNTNTGNVLVTAGSDARAISVGNYWLLICKITNNTTGNTTLTIQVYPATGTNSGSDPGTDNVAATGSAVVWGAQLEKAAFLSSYIKTQGSAVTRAADSLTMPYNFGAMDFTAIARVARPAHADASGTLGVHCGVFQLGTADLSPTMYFASANRTLCAQLRTGGSNAQRTLIASAQIVGVAQFKNITTAPQASLDIGGGPSAFSTAVAAASGFGNQTLRVGWATEGGSDGLFGVLLDLMPVRGLFTYAEAVAIP